MSDLRWTECNWEFWNLLLKNGFKTDNLLGHESVKSIRFNLTNKIILGWASCSQAHTKHYEYKYISNKDLIEKLDESKQSMNNKKIAIKVGNNQELSRIVQEFLFSKGFWWLKGEKDYKNWPEQYNSNGCIIFESGSKSLHHGRERSEFKVYDAATQFGEIITLLSEPPKPVIKIKNDAGQEYEADFKENPGYVTFGCAKIATKTFAALNETLNTKVAPDSKAVEQIKIGRGLFTPADIEAIIKHPDFKTA